MTITISISAQVNVARFSPIRMPVWSVAITISDSPSQTCAEVQALSDQRPGVIVRLRMPSKVSQPISPAPVVPST